MSTVYRRKVRRPSGELVPSRFYWCSWHHPERGLVRESTKCVDKRAAEAFVRARERTAHSPDPAAHSTPLRVAIATYKSAKAGAGRAKGTLAMIDQKSAHLARLLGDETLVRSISPADVDRYVSTRQAEGAANNTIAKELSTLIGLLKLAARHGLCEHPARLKPLDFAAGYVPRRTCLASPEALRKLLLAPGRGSEARRAVGRRPVVTHVICAGPGAQDYRPRTRWPKRWRVVWYYDDCSFCYGSGCGGCNGGEAWWSEATAPRRRVYRVRATGRVLGRFRGRR